MDAGLDGQFELGADTIGAGDQHRCVEALHRQLEQGTETAQSGQNPGAPGFRHCGFDALDKFLAGVDIDTCCAIAQSMRRVAGGAGFILNTHVRTPVGGVKAGALW